MIQCVYVVLGSNLVELCEQIQVVFDVFEWFFEICLVVVLLFYISDLFGFVDQLCFVNGVVVFDINLVLFDLFDVLQVIELEQGCVCDLCWGLCMFDLDILLFGE